MASTRYKRAIRSIAGFLLPLVLAALIIIIFYTGISQISDTSVSKEQETLTRALNRGAVSAYSLNGRYPQSLDELLNDYHFTYDSSRFIVEYIPNGQNLYPQIAVLPLAPGK